MAQNVPFYIKLRTLLYCEHVYL